MGHKGLGFRGFGFRALGIGGLEFRGLGFLGFRVEGLGSQYLKNCFGVCYVRNVIRNPKHSGLDMTCQPQIKTTLGVPLCCRLYMLLVVISHLFIGTIRLKARTLHHTDHGPEPNNSCMTTPAFLMELSSVIFPVRARLESSIRALTA